MKLSQSTLQRPRQACTFQQLNILHDPLETRWFVPEAKKYSMMVLWGTLEVRTSHVSA